MAPLANENVHGGAFCGTHCSVQGENKNSGQHLENSIQQTIFSSSWSPPSSIGSTLHASVGSRRCRQVIDIRGRRPKSPSKAQNKYDSNESVQRFEGQDKIQILRLVQVLRIV